MHFFVFVFTLDFKVFLTFPFYFVGVNLVFSDCEEVVAVIHKLLSVTEVLGDQIVKRFECIKLPLTVL